MFDISHNFVYSIVESLLDTVQILFYESTCTCTSTISPFCIKLRDYTCKIANIKLLPEFNIVHNCQKINTARF